MHFLFDSQPVRMYVSDGGEGDPAQMKRQRYLCMLYKSVSRFVRSGGCLVVNLRTMFYSCLERGDSGSARQFTRAESES